MTVDEGGFVDASARSGKSFGTLGTVAMTWVAISDTGRVRTTNEDGALTGPGIFVLADGMGGHDGGELASAAVLEALSEVFDSSVPDAHAAMTAVNEQLAQAHTRIEELDSETGKRAGTTVTGILLTTYEDVPHWLVINIGDSRTYRYSGGYFEQLTVDHSQVQELVDGGFLSPEEARTDPRRNVITRALGAGMEPHADFWIVPVQSGDRLLMCSDGLNGELTDQEMYQILAGEEDLEAVGDSLLADALAAGGRDNVTLILVDVALTDVPTEQIDMSANHKSIIGTENIEIP